MPRSPLPSGAAGAGANTSLAVTAGASRLSLLLTAVSHPAPAGLVAAAMDADLFNAWFQVADQDRDGLISGGEAVTFFQRSGLSQDTLFQAGRPASALREKQRAQ